MKNNIDDKYFSGTSGLLLPVPNKLSYPEEFKDKSRLHFYSSLMNSIEINSSFYKTPMAATVSKWANDVPDHFKFTFKLSKEITHQKGLDFDREKVKHFMEVISAVGNKKGCLLIQFPPSIRLGDIRQIRLLINELRITDPHQEWNIAIEVRHPSLYHSSLYKLSEDYHVGIVIQDKPQAPTPHLETNLPFIYLRFHGPDGDYRGSYQDPVLYEYTSYIKEWIADGKIVYTYFNNTMGKAIENLNTLRDVLIDAETD